MGYTHYWRKQKELDQALFGKAARDCEKAVRASKITVVYEYFESGKPAVFTHDLVRFNGKREDGHETFYVERVVSPEDWEKPDEKGRYFAFCKTACKPYDLCVTACLIIFKHYFGDIFYIASDGEDTDWDDGRKLVQDTLGYGADFSLKQDEE